jgi:hypothetical protein
MDLSGKVNATPRVSDSLTAYSISTGSIPWHQANWSDLITTTTRAMPNQV